MKTARVFKSGNSQAIRLPKDYRFNSTEVEIYRRGGEVVLREKRRALAARLSCLPLCLTISWQAAGWIGRRRSAKNYDRATFHVRYERVLRTE